ncbi:glycosyltransferase family 4 protein [Niabella insulamsoli]|uniref:glycosyltransferase family 4 protein n=1 Tax=Niabella insulamsoli TaxID=3144874 RepID=UPI0031FC55B5
MKRIGIEVQRLFRKKKHGMEVVALELIKELQQIDKENEYVLFAKDDEDAQCIRETEKFRINKPGGYTYADWEQWSLPREIKKEKIDFLHATCNTAALNPGVPLMLTLHDIIYLESLNFKGTAYQNFGNIYRKFVVPKAVEKSKVIVTVSNFEKDTIIKRLKVPEEKVKVIYNAANPKFNNQYDKELVRQFKEKYKLPDSFILFLGNTAPKKNTPNLIEAYIHYLNSVNNPEPLVVLDYDAELVKNKLKEKNKSELIKWFVFPGFINASEMPLIYNAASLYVYPSLRESFGLPILEAMGCGTPVITSNTSSMPEIGGDAAIYIDPYNHVDIAEKMHSVLKDKDLQQDLSDKGVKRAAEFSWKTSATQLLDLYRSMP